MLKGYKLSFDQLTKCIIECQNLKSVEWVHFSGGEPTLWTEGDRDLVDLLLEISKAGFEPGFTTNGSMFLDYTKCKDFFDKYFNNADKKIRLYISIDTFHNNFNFESGRAECLDNVIKYKLQLSPEKTKLLDIVVLVTISKDPGSLLPDKMVKHYQSQDVDFNFVPLIAEGKARSFSSICPDLKSETPEDLGAYYPYHQKGRYDFVKSDIILIDDDYYIYKYDHGIEITDRWHKFTKLGHLVENIMRDCR
jgi:MoaA/NifB/PqqE/SkfB family radical SAM enzyme